MAQLNPVVAGQMVNSVSMLKREHLFIKGNKGTGESLVTLYSYASAAGNVNVTQLTTQAILAANKADENVITTHWQKFIPIGQNWLKTVLVMK